MNEMELSTDLVAQWIAHEMVANGIIDKVPGGDLVFYGDRHDFRIQVIAHKMDRRDTVRLKESRDRYERGYD